VESWPNVSAHKLVSNAAAVKVSYLWWIIQMRLQSSASSSRRQSANRPSVFSPMIRSPRTALGCDAFAHGSHQANQALTRIPPCCIVTSHSLAPRVLGIKPDSCTNMITCKASVASSSNTSDQVSPSPMRQSIVKLNTHFHCSLNPIVPSSSRGASSSSSAS
jgi:hypothetical protein